MIKKNFSKRIVRYVIIKVADGREYVLQRVIHCGGGRINEFTVRSL
jgi:hypothetical protein